MTAKNDNEILILTDSAADIPAEIVRAANIRVLPLHVYIGSDHYLDGIDISSETFYSRLRSGEAFPETSPPSEEDFHQIFMENIGQKDILGIFLSGKMSQTYNIATKTKMKYYNRYLRERAATPGKSKKFQIELVDSRLVSMGTGLLVAEAAQKAGEGWSLPAIKQHIETRREQVGIHLMVDNLDHLVRGGRIGQASALVGKLFDFKPLLGMKSGVVVPGGKAMGVKRAYKKIVESIEAELQDREKPFVAALCSGGDRTDSGLLAEMLQKSFANLKMIESDFGPGVGTHTGPGAVGVAFLPDAP